MKLTLERKILAGVLSLAAAACVLDRVAAGGLTGPASASASATLPATAEAIRSALPAALEVEPAATPAPNGLPTLADRLAEAEKLLRARTPDVFATPLQTATPAGPAAEAAPELPLDRQAFARNHPLQAIANVDGQASAMIANRIMRQGDEIEGVLLVQIAERWVTWEGRGVQFRVHLDPRW